MTTYYNGKTYTVTAIRSIRPYQGPQWLVEPTGQWDDDTDHPGYDDADSNRIIETTIKGWEADCIIRLTVSTGEYNESSWDYLARLQLAGRITGATPEQLATARLLVSLENTIRYWESGDRIPSAVYARALADALQLDPDDAL